MDYGPTTYGDSWADVYDDPEIGWPSPDKAVAFLAARAGGGPVLEIGVGTGRIAIPLARRGVAVTGVDASERMLEALRAKPGGDLVAARHGCLPEHHDPRHYRLIYALGQSFLQLSDAATQSATLRWVATHLEPAGRFVVDSLVPDPQRFRMRQDLMTTGIGPEHVLLTASTHDPLHQVIRSGTVRVTADGLRLRPNFIRYSSPPELLHMARAAGLAPVGRWVSFDGAPFTGRPGAYVCEFRLVPPRVG